MLQPSTGAFASTLHAVNNYSKPTRAYQITNLYMHCTADTGMVPELLLTQHPWGPRLCNSQPTFNLIKAHTDNCPETSTAGSDIGLS